MRGSDETPSCKKNDPDTTNRNFNLLKTQNPTAAQISLKVGSSKSKCPRLFPREDEPAPPHLHL